MSTVTIHKIKKDPITEAIILTMRVTTLCLLSLSAATAFTQQSSSRPSFMTAHQQAPKSALHMSTPIDQEVPIIVNGQNIELTEALTEHVKLKIGGTLAKLASGGAVTECDVVLSVSKNPKVCVQCVVSNFKRARKVSRECQWIISLLTL
jgi:hypothetical protein